MEYLTDDLYFTISTGTARQKVVLTGGLTSGRVPYATTNGRLTDSANLAFTGSELDLTGSLSVASGNIGVGGAPSPYGNAGTENAFYLARVFTDATASAAKRGQYQLIDWNPGTGGGSVTQYVIGCDATVRTTATETVSNTGYLVGSHSAVLHASGSAVSLIYGLWIEVGTYNAGSDTTGTITNLYGIHVDGLKTASSTINNAFGIYVHGMAGSTVYDLYCGDSGAYNYLAGKTGIGAAVSSSYQLSIGGLGNIYTTDGTSAMRVLDMSGFGYGPGTYPVLVIGPTSGNGTVAIGYDPSANNDNSFSGDGREVLFRRGAQFVTPNAANNGFYLYNIVLLDGHVGIGRSPTAGRLHVAAGSATAGTAPIMLTSGTLLSSPEAGAIEYYADDLYFTIATGPARQKIALTAGLTSGRIPYATTNGRLTDSAKMAFDGTYLSAVLAGEYQVRSLTSPINNYNLFSLDLTDYSQIVTAVTGSGAVTQAFACGIASTGTTAGSAASQRLSGNQMHMSGFSMGRINTNYLSGNCFAAVGLFVDPMAITVSSRVRTSNHAAFFFEDDQWYCSVADGSGQTIEAVTINGANHVVEIDGRTSGHMIFRVDGTVVKHFTTNVSPTWGYWQWHIHNKALTSDQKLYFYNVGYFGV